MERLLTVEDVSEVLGIPKQTLYGSRTRGGDYPPAIRIGRHLRWRKTDVEAYIERRFAETKK